MDIDYNEVKSKLIQIRAYLRELENDYSDINNLLKDSLLINDKLPNEEEMINISKTNLDVINEINNFVLPIINERI